jgi:hypothetical protein
LTEHKNNKIGITYHPEKFLQKLDDLDPEKSKSFLQDEFIKYGRFFGLGNFFSLKSYLGFQQRI